MRKRAVLAGFNCSSILLPAEPVGALAPGEEGICNAYLPISSTLARFFWVIRLYARNGFVVIIDDHTGDTTVKGDHGAWRGVRRYSSSIAYNVRVRTLPSGCKLIVMHFGFSNFCSHEGNSSTDHACLMTMHCYKLLMLITYSGLTNDGLNLYCHSCIRQKHALGPTSGL